MNPYILKGFKKKVYFFLKEYKVTGVKNEKKKNLFKIHMPVTRLKHNQTI